MKIIISLYQCFILMFREAAIKKKNPPLMARPLIGGGGGVKAGL